MDIQIVLLNYYLNNMHYMCLLNIYWRETEARMKERKKTAGRQLPFPSLFPSLLLFLHKESG